MPGVKVMTGAATPPSPDDVRRKANPGDATDATSSDVLRIRAGEGKGLKNRAETQGPNRT
jgi:hypothetical protein